MRLDQVIARGTRAAQPLANTRPNGSLYYVTDEQRLEQVTAGAWSLFSPLGADLSGLTNGKLPYADTPTTLNNSVASQSSEDERAPGSPSEPATFFIVDGTGAPIAGLLLIFDYADPDNCAGLAITLRDQTPDAEITFAPLLRGTTPFSGGVIRIESPDGDTSIEIGNGQFILNSGGPDLRLEASDLFPGDDATIALGKSDRRFSALYLTDLPTSDPHVEGQVWVGPLGALMISSG
jgi:hypothetical protein